MIALLIEYDGTNYVGWQRQPDGISIQQTIENAISSLVGSPVTVTGAGRTDSGVHAAGQVAHAATGMRSVPEQKLSVAINTRLPHDIRVREARYVADDFHARFQAVSREYEYHIALSQNVFRNRYAWFPTLPYDRNLLSQAASVFIGTHDFTTFSKHNPATRSYTCTVEHCAVEPSADELIIRIRADRFVYGMCRGLVGAMMSVARGRCSIDEIRDALLAADRTFHEFSVPAHGLTLHKVYYNTQLFSNTQTDS